MSFLKKLFLEQTEETKSNTQTKKEVSFVQTETIQPKNVNVEFVNELQPVVMRDPKIKQMFDEFFKEVNKPGFDFLEFHEMTLAFNKKEQFDVVKQTLSSLGIIVNKDSLLIDAKYYLDKIHEIVETTTKNGETKLSSLEQDSASKTQNLLKEKESLQNRLAQIEQELSNTTMSNKIEQENIRQTLKSLKIEEQYVIAEVNQTIKNINSYL